MLIKRGNSKNRKFFTRTDVSLLRPLEITELVIRALILLVRYRRLRGSHLVDLLSPCVEADTQEKKADDLQRFIRALFDHELIDREIEPIREAVTGFRSPICKIDQKGAATLRRYAKEYRISDLIMKRIPFALKKIKPLFVAHTLAIADVIAVIEAAALTDPTIEFLTPEQLFDDSPEETKRKHKPFAWNVAYAGAVQTIGVEPDHFLFGLRFLNRSAGWNTRHFAPEIDRGSMPYARDKLYQTSLRRKYLAYLLSTQQDIYQKRFNIPRVSPRVSILTTTTTTERIDSIVHMLGEEHFAQMDKYRHSDFLFIETDTLINSFQEGKDIFSLAWRNGRGASVRAMQPASIRDPERFFEILKDELDQPLRQAIHTSLVRPTLTIRTQYEATTPDTYQVVVRATVTIQDVVIELERRCGSARNGAIEKADHVKQSITSSAAALALPVHVDELPSDFTTQRLTGADLPMTKQCATPREPKITLTPEVQEVLRFLEQSRSHSFLTGKAGTGKSTLLQYFRSRTRKHIVVLAPTGVAALNVQGQTIHAFFGFRPGITPRMT